jgi:signal transduction histidine kinase
MSTVIHMPGNDEVAFRESLSTNHHVAGLPGAFQVRKVCQLQLEHLVAQLPILYTRLVYQAPEHDRHELRLPLPQTRPTLDTTLLRYLESEAWLFESLPILKLCPLDVKAACVYVYRLSQSITQPEYLLIWALEALGASQQQIVEQYAQRMREWIAVDREIARQQQEIRLLEQILRRAEHQLRNPLALIGLYAENLRLGLPEGSLQEQALLIRDTVNELSRNLTDLIHYGECSKLRFSTCDLRLLLIECIKSMEPWLSQKQLQVSYPNTAVSLMVDGWQMKQVLSNLLSNAIHFSPMGGTVTWHWCVFQHEVLVEVRDQGRGLSEEDLQQAFTPYYSRRPGGTGLGLAIAKKTILDHQGSIWVQNLPGGGAQFSFTLPRNPFSV